MSTQVSPKFRRAVEVEVRRLQGQRRTTEADRQAQAVKDLKAGRQSFIQARRSLGYAETSLQAWARETGNSTVNALAGRLANIVDDLDKIEPNLERIHVQANRLK